MAGLRQNQLLAALSAVDLKRVWSGLEGVVAMPLGHVVCESGRALGGTRHAGRLAKMKSDPRTGFATCQTITAALQKRFG